MRLQEDGAWGDLTIWRDTGSSSYSLKDIAGSSSKCLAVKAPLRSIFFGKGPCSERTGEVIRT